MALADILGLAAQQQAGRNSFVDGLYAPGLQTVARSQDQQNWLGNAKNQSNSINAMPFVLDPNKLSTDATANKNLMYPAMLQPGGVSQVIAGGKNIGPDLSAAYPKTDFSGANTIDALVSIVTQKTGMSADDAKSWIMGLLPSVSGNGTFGQSGGASGATKPTADPSVQNMQDAFQS